MWRAVLIGAAAVWLAGTVAMRPAVARPDNEAVEQFGLPGHWAIACSVKPSPNNPHIFVGTSESGPPTRRLQTGNVEIDNVLELNNARLVGDKQLTMQESIEGKIVTFLLVMDKDRYRVDEMVTSDGKALVTHAVQNFDGKPSPWYRRCSP